MMEAVKEKVELQKYSDYKDSNVDWLGQVPEHWEILPGYAFLKERSEKNTGMKESQVLSLSYGNVIVKPEEKLTGLVPESFETYQLVYPGDIVIRPTDLQNDKTSLRTGIAKDKGIITSAYMNLSVKGANSNKYFHYLFHSIDTNKVIYGLGSGLRQNLSYDDFKRFPFPVPSPEEQTAIVHFLDRKTEQINQAIEIKQKQIELLKERRQILIHKAVTRGLNPDAPLKPSGVDWIGDIPEHWEVKALKYIGDAKIGLTYSPTDLCDKGQGVLVLRSSNLNEGRFRYGEDFNKYVNCRIPDDLIIRKNDILICSRNGSRDLIGKCAIAKTDQDIGNSFGAFTTVFRSEMNSYLFNIMNSDIFKTLSGSFLTSTINQLTLGNLNSIKIPIPPKKERDEITDYVETNRSKIYQSIQNLIIEIKKLKEYKTTLINSAVTGKIKVS